MIPLIKSLQSTYDFDICGICESMLSDNFSNNEIVINSFSSDPFRADKAASICNVGVIYIIRNHSALSKDRMSKLPETVVAEIKFNKKKIFFILSYRHPVMTNEEAVVYMNRLEKIYESIWKENLYMSILWCRL